MPLPATPGTAVLVIGSQSPYRSAAHPTQNASSLRAHAVYAPSAGLCDVYHWVCLSRASTQPTRGGVISSNPTGCGAQELGDGPRTCSAADPVGASAAPS